MIDLLLGSYRSNSLLIANFGSHTIVCWTLVAGNINGTSRSSTALLNGPVGITLDPTGKVYVADSNNHRVQLFLTNQSTGITIAGVTGVLGSNTALLNYPFWPLLNNQLNLYVKDYLNHRVQKFNRY